MHSHIAQVFVRMVCRLRVAWLTPLAAAVTF